MDRISDIAAIVSEAILEDGREPTRIPFLSFLRSSHPTPFGRGMLSPSLCLIVQGRKETHFGREITGYGAGEYLLAAVDMPSAGQVVGASKSAPYLAVRLEFDAREMAAVIVEAKIELPAMRRSAPGAFVGRSDAELQEAVYKLVRLLEKPRDADFLADAVKREIMYRLLTGTNAHLLYQNVVIESQETGVGAAIQWLKQNFHRPLKIEQLAQDSNMSVSSLHHKFKAVTTMGPLQYQKQLRLQEARRLLLSGTIDAATAAFQVGYDSQSQFTREYRRLFDAPPMRDVKMLFQNGEIDENRRSNLH